MKAIFSDTCEISQYKPMFKIGDNYAVAFECKTLKGTAKPKLKNGRFVKTDEIVDTNECTFKYVVFNSKPSVKEIRETIEEYVNSNVSNKIINGFVYDGKKINLSKENQMNYKAAYDLAVQTNGANLPYKIKTSSLNGSTAQYIVFNTLEEISTFYLGMNEHINKCLEKGWETKDSIDYSIYVA